MPDKKMRPDWDLAGTRGGWILLAQRLFGANLKY
jgi:hypothetical protein